MTARAEQAILLRAGAATLRNRGRLEATQGGRSAGPVGAQGPASAAPG